ncbi:hypothetical protein TNCV_4275211 [Trichonephila clavipes]|nr:hypothetical protein TNCV_4275211 [Trichonephila clavipes]
MSSSLESLKTTKGLSEFVYRDVLDFVALSAPAKKKGDLLCSISETYRGITPEIQIPVNSWALCKNSKSDRENSRKCFGFFPYKVVTASSLRWHLAGHRSPLMHGAIKTLH